MPLVRPIIAQVLEGDLHPNQKGRAHPALFLGLFAPEEWQETNNKVVTPGSWAHLKGLVVQTFACLGVLGLLGALGAGTRQGKRGELELDVHLGSQSLLPRSLKKKSWPAVHAHPTREILRSPTLFLPPF